jgi:thiosulfate/3-mercaptopyruvate sulfurtransferase
VAGFQGVATAASCAPCHNTIINSAASGLHTTLGGYPVILGQRGFTLMDPTSQARFDEQCTQCHTAVGTQPPETACGQCHVAVPAPAGGGFLGGHAFWGTPSMDNNCTACHGSRVKDEYYGQNNDLLERNKPFLAADLPWKDPAYTLQPDVHRVAGFECVACHTGDEMHGVGAPIAGDRYDVTGAPTCEGCHTNLPGSSYHSTGHLASMDCQVCHAQPYKNCFECHTDVTSTGQPFFTIADGDPGANNDHLMTFRVGKNPRYIPGGSEKEYAVLRHVPVDQDVFAYTGGNVVNGLIPNMTASPTWKKATPHNIRRVTPIQSCPNCHGPDYAKFWLTDPIQNAEGWISPAYQPDEIGANAGVIQPTPPSTAPLR